MDIYIKGHKGLTVASELTPVESSPVYNEHADIAHAYTAYGSYISYAYFDSYSYQYSYSYSYTAYSYDSYITATTITEWVNPLTSNSIQTPSDFTPYQYMNPDVAVTAGARE